MSLDKLVDSAQLDSDLTAVANAIRTKGGTSGQLAFPAGFVSAIGNIPTGTTPTGTKQISITQNGTTTEDVAAYANAEITVNVPTGGGGSGNAEYSSGHFTQTTQYASTDRMPIAHGLSATPKYYAIWCGDIDNTVRRYQGNMYVANMVLRVNGNVGNPTPVFITAVNGATSGTQTLVPDDLTNPTPDSTNIYLCISRTSNIVPAGTEIYWEAATW